MPSKPWINAALAAALALPACADVTVKRVTSTEGMMAFSSESTEYLKGTERRSDSLTKFEGFIMNKMAGGSRSNIVLPERDKMIDVDHARKAYREGSISEMAKKMQQATAQAADKKKDRKPTCRITKTDVKVEPSGEKSTVNGYACERVRLTLLMEMEDLQTQRKSEMRLVTDNWNAAETAPLKALRESEAVFGRAFAKAMGLSLSPEEGQRWGLGMAALWGLSDEDMKAKVGQMKKEMEKFKGVPVATEIAWYMKQEGAAAASAAKPAASSEDSKMPSLSGGAAGIAGGLAGMMMKKKMEASAAQAEQKSQARTSGQEPLFKSRVEIREVKVGAVDASLFEVPAGYKPQK